ncbi:class I SAM-dependent methyltransferase [Pseudonocardia kunmingensis]|uniref:Methyltransferase family protein n=1 Tax=Pseudonocardia kunmingensis TaxID=630975 RepID=A0A543DLJ7_9PSEU|nr:class I SAM-dependent methyltransferase [Pseudonocardia kunmingensis]TQM10191.1 methyltransferase family protein [Pseudonocardia kunmingensis]
MRTVTAASLSAGNLLYREPALHDELHADSTVADDVLDAVSCSGARIESVLDLGCGTGHVLADLHKRRGWSAAGVDIQPEPLDHARAHHPQIRFRVGDLRTVRLGARFDLVLCLGNTLAYLHTETELAAAFDTIAAHSRPGSLAVICTLTDPGRDVQSTTRATTRTAGTADVTTSARWDPISGFLTTTRSWRFDDGRTAEDRIVRRVWSSDALRQQAARAALRPPIFLAA